MAEAGCTQEGRLFYRAIRDQTPTLHDFLSAKTLAELALQRGRRPRKPPTAPERLAVWDGVSVHDSEEGARETALFYHMRLGAFIARLRIIDGGPITHKKTLGRGHYTPWGEPAAMLEQVESVTTV